MNEIATIASNLPGHNDVIFLLLIVIIWEMVWKGVALWHAGKRKQMTWFIFLFIFNTVGILPIIYLILNRKNKGK
ncbi:MAG TPA: DUF5652 family protein [Candidatus Absconditabacterales bacterium]|nr:DUF5652 family protein [Candidatus Absconditabacterales bacterium]